MNESSGGNAMLLFGGCALLLLVALCAVGAGMMLFGVGAGSSVVPAGPGRGPAPIPTPGDDPLVGCWNAGPQDPGVECYGPTGQYTIDNGRTGIQRGTWRRTGPEQIEVTLESPVTWQATCTSPYVCTFRNASGTFAFQRTARGAIPR